MYRNIRKYIRWLQLFYRKAYHIPDQATAYARPQPGDSNSGQHLDPKTLPKNNCTQQTAWQNGGFRTYPGLQIPVRLQSEATIS